MTKENYRHTHPISILQNLRRIMFIFIIPLLRGLFNAFTAGGFYGWLEGAYFDIIVLLAAIAFATARWHEHVFHYDGEGIYIRKGIIHKRSFYISSDQIATTMFLEPFYLRPLRAVHLIGDTNAGMARSTDFDLMIFKKDAEILLGIRQRGYAGEDFAPREYKPRSLYITALSAFLSNSLVGVLIIYTIFSQMGTLVGDEIEERLVETFSVILQLLAVNLPPLLTWIGVAFLGGWLIAFIQNLFRYLFFMATRNRSAIQIRGGLFTKRRYFMLLEKMNYLDIRQSILTKIFGLELTFIYCTGYGKDKYSSPVLIPAATKSEMVSTLRLLLPEYKIVRRKLKPKHFASVGTYVWLPLTLAAASYITAAILIFFIPEWEEVIKFLSLMLSIPFLWMFLIKAFDFATTGIGKNKNAYTLYYSTTFYLHTIVIPKNKVTKIIVRQSPPQKRAGVCTVVVHSFAEQRKRHTVRSLDKEQVLKFLGDIHPYTVVEETDADVIIE